MSGRGIVGDWGSIAKKRLGKWRKQHNNKLNQDEKEIIKFSSH